MAVDARAKVWRVARERGRPARMPDCPEVRAVRSKLKGFRSRGMSLKAMRDQTGVSIGVLSLTITQEGRGMLRSTYNKLLPLEYDTGDEGDFGAQVPTFPSVRRLRALWADGFSRRWLAGRLGSNDKHLWAVMHGRSVYIFADYAHRIEVLYDEIGGKSPVEMGVHPHGARCARAAAAKRGYAPRSCWDPDTIDDPEAIPEWTGLCGTTPGYAIHRRDFIPMCQPCNDARNQYQKERRKAAKDANQGKVEAAADSAEVG